MAYKPLNTQLIMAHGAATKAIKSYQSCSYSEPRINMETGETIITGSIGTVTLQLYGENLHKQMSVSTVKLFYTIIAAFTDNSQHDLTITFSENEYYRLNGWGIIPSDESEQEKKRALNCLGQARRTTKKDLNILHNLSLSWTEVIKKEKRKKGTEQSFMKVHLFQKVGIRNGIITVQLGTDFAEYLHHLPFRILRKEILLISARRPHEVCIALQLTDLWYNSLAKNQGHNNIIRIRTLLENAGLPSCEAARAHRKSWQYAIKDPTENALNDLEEIGLIRNWHYKNDIVVSNYEEWTDQVIVFEIAEENPGI